MLTVVLAASCAREPRNTRTEQDAITADVNRSFEIDNLRESGALSRIEIGGSGIAVIVGPAFERLSFYDKSRALAVVARVVKPERGGDFFVLYDSRTNKKVGTWVNNEGLKLK